MSGSDEHGDSPEPGRHGLPELMAERRAKAERLKETDPSAFPYAFAGAEPIEEILDAYAQLADGEETEDSHRVAGRLTARRGAGKAAFLDLADRTGKIQLHARLDVLGRESFDRLLSLDLGDLLGVDGAVLRSRHGELTLRVDGFQVLSKALRPPPDKHHGLTHVETRHRRRELDLIANEETRRLFTDRARIIAAARAYLDELEVPRHDVHLDLARVRRLSIAALAALSDDELASRVGVPISVAPVLRGARDLVEARSYAELVLEPAEAKVDSPETLARFRELVEAGLEPRALVRELKAVGGDLKALRLALTGRDRGPELAAVIAALPRDELLRRAT